MKTVSSLIFTVLLYCPGFATAQVPTEAQAVSEMSFLVGTWVGQGWFEISSKRFTFNIREAVESKLNGSLLQIDGLSDNHEAYTTFWFDSKAKVYRWQSHTCSKAGTDFFDVVPDVQPNKLIWQTPKNEKSGLISRFTISLNEKGQWFEIGEQSSDGKKWTKFMEQTLSKLP